MAVAFMGCAPNPFFSFWLTCAPPPCEQPLLDAPLVGLCALFFGKHRTHFTPNLCSPISLQQASSVRFLALPPGVISQSCHTGPHRPKNARLVVTSTVHVINPPQAKPKLPHCFAGRIIALQDGIIFVFTGCLPVLQAAKLFVDNCPAGRMLRKIVLQGA